MLNNIKWVAFSQAIKIICQVLSLVLLARWMSPTEYGLLAMVGVIVALGMLFRDFGTSAALIQKRRVSESLKDSVFTLNCIIGVLISLIIAVIAQNVADFFNQEKLVYVLIIIGLTFPITSLSSTQKALMERESKFKKLSNIESLSILISTMVCLVVAYNGGGVYSLVVQSILNSIISTFLIWKSSEWNPKKINLKMKQDIKEIWSFSGNLIAFNTVNYFYRNADRYIIGKVMVSAILGAYDLAYKIMLFPIQMITFVIGRALFPVFSELQSNEKEFNRVFIKVTVLIALCSFPILTGLMALNHEIINLVFGKEWVMVALLIFWLSPTGMMQALSSTTGGVLMAKGRTDILFRLGVLGAFLTLIGFFSAIYISNSIIFFTQVYLFSNVLNFFISIFFVCRFLKISFIHYINSIFPILINSIIMYLILFFSNSFDFMNLGLKIFLGSLVYLILLFFINNEIVNEIYVEFINKFKRALS